MSTPDGLRTGTGTTLIKYWSEYNIPGRGTLGKSSVLGQAAFVEIAPGKFLFAVLDRRYNTTHHHALAQRTFSEKIDHATSVEGRWYELSRLKATATIKPADYPLLVTFDDPADPSSVEEVNPRNLSATFGQSVSLRSITLSVGERTPPQQSIVTVLPWLETRRAGRLLDDQRYQDARLDNIANKLAASSFIRK